MTMNGLSCIIANCGVLHAITPPPDGRDYRTYAEYKAAKEAWDRAQCWRAYVR